MYGGGLHALPGSVFWTRRCTCLKLVVSGRGWSWPWSGGGVSVEARPQRGWSLGRFQCVQRVQAGVQLCAVCGAGLDSPMAGLLSCARRPAAWHEEVSMSGGCLADTSWPFQSRRPNDEAMMRLMRPPFNSTQPVQQCRWRRRGASEPSPQKMGTKPGASPSCGETCLRDQVSRAIT